MQIHTEGLVIRESSVGESDRLVTLLTREEGVVRAFARKAKNPAQQAGVFHPAFVLFPPYAV